MLQLCPTLCHRMDCGPPSREVHGFLQARLLEWAAISFSRGSSQLRNQTRISCIALRFFNAAPPGKPVSLHGLAIKLIPLQTPTFQVVWLLCASGTQTCVNTCAHVAIQMTAPMSGGKRQGFITL